MITVKFFGGAKKSFSTEKITIGEPLGTIQNLIDFLETKKPKDSPKIDFGNILIAINGIDSSALQGNNTEVKSGDVVSIIPVIHGGTLKRNHFKIYNYNVEIMEISSREIKMDFLDFLRKKFPKLNLQGVFSPFVLNKNHAKKIIKISLTSKKNNNLLSNKLETDIILRFAGTNQISNAIKEAGLKPKKNFILIAIGEKKSIDKLFSELKPFLIEKPFSKDNRKFLQKYFQISNERLKTIVSKHPLEDLLAEKAALLF